MNFEQAFELLLGHEGGFVDNPDDPGGGLLDWFESRQCRKTSANRKRKGYKA